MLSKNIDSAEIASRIFTGGKNDKLGSLILNNYENIDKKVINNVLIDSINLNKASKDVDNMFKDLSDNMKSSVFYKTYEYNKDRPETDRHAHSLRSSYELAGVFKALYYTNTSSHLKDNKLKETIYEYIKNKGGFNSVEPALFNKRKSLESLSTSILIDNSNKVNKIVNKIINLVDKFEKEKTNNKNDFKSIIKFFKLLHKLRYNIISKENKIYLDMNNIISALKIAFPESDKNIMAMFLYMERNKEDLRKALDAQAQKFNLKIEAKVNK
jgi:hypothetical protein